MPVRLPSGGGGLDIFHLQLVRGRVEHIAFFSGQISFGLFLKQDQRFNDELGLLQILFVDIGNGIWDLSHKNHRLVGKTADVIDKIRFVDV